eukprot:TRINITY_DN1351_c0_g1_i2.p1 TRINITY_DN1351_c0_g1~~TRINITY_DN1351_c0_g1_i2.p1  ORF type:complete len:307 (-),score=59.79 TRINITY_DN1351_c0_g1_i2:67-849(-)
MTEDDTPEDKHAKEFDVTLRTTPEQSIARANVVHEIDLEMDYATDIQVTREEVEGVPEAFILHNVLTAEECQRYIDETERLGYTDAPLTVGNNRYEMATDVRDNLRVMWQATPRMMDPIWQRVSSFFPPVLRVGPNDWGLVQEGALNERFRFYRYEAEQRFRPHFDGCFRRRTGEQSHYTFILYLNDGFDGGETTFFPEDCNFMRGRPKAGMERRVNPRRGSVLVFRHTGANSPLHEGSPHHTQGMHKYALRSDVMYKPL